ncbi:MAG: histidine phosphatase family protein [Candidatus Pacebacteria bacterium]|jgi:broad specificity phosphatase PhoE|nr:histidine phosphatase family protein [Candidatus Paceibacterota bacterium]
MDVYFVRHGQTDGNVAQRHQHPDISLNEVGKVQASTVAKLIRRIRPTHLITSTNKRALETATQIGLTTDLIPETYPAFEELRRPAFFIGKRFSDPETLRYVWGWFFGMKSASMHDGESYADFRQRLIAARSHLANLPDSARVVVVSHAVFINFFIEHMNKDGHMGLRRAAWRIIAIFRIKNTAVTHLRYENGRWRIVERF